MHPPGPENGRAEHPREMSGPHEKLSSNDDDTISLWPRNVEFLRSRGIKYVWRQDKQDIRVVCPCCGGMMILAEDKPWFMCISIACEAHLFSFHDIVISLPVDQDEATP